MEEMPTPAPSLLPTLAFSAWLGETLAADRGDGGIEVACGECRGCCTSSYFIHIAPDEKAALACIPKGLLFSAPGLPKGHKLLGYDDKGHCPMFKDNACSIYEDRPRTCRAYDCRVFAATGFTEGEGKPVIALQAERWRFGFDTAEDESRFAAVQASARFLRNHAARFPTGLLPSNAPQKAMLAIRMHGMFMGEGWSGLSLDAQILRYQEAVSLISRSKAGRGAVTKSDPEGIR